MDLLKYGKPFWQSTGDVTLALHMTSREVLTPCWCRACSHMVSLWPTVQGRVQAWQSSVENSSKGRD